MEKATEIIIGVGLKKDGFIQLICGEERYTISPDVAMELAKSIASCLREVEAKRTAA